MGAVRTYDSEGQTAFEITYGGKESPFGGVDSSAPPAYIDPRCAAAMDGFVVVDNKLCVVSLQPIPLPTNLWDSVPNIILLKVGTFYNSLTGQLNYAFGYTAVAFAGPPSGVNYTFYMTSWNPANPASQGTDILPLTLFDAATIQEYASITLDCIATNVAATATGSGATGSITGVNAEGEVTAATLTGGTNYGVGDIVQGIQLGSSGLQLWFKVLTVTGSAIATTSIYNPGIHYVTGPISAGSVEGASGLTLIINGPAGLNTYTVNSTAGGYNRQQAVAAMVALINGEPDPNATAASSEDGYSLILTAVQIGTNGNLVDVQDTSTSEVAGNAPPFYFSCRSPRYLQGGAITENSMAPHAFTSPVSVAEVGGTLYFANLGPMILKYSGVGTLTTSSLYNGMGVIRKFAGSLIGLRQQNQLGIYTQNQDMIFAWTAGEDLDEWVPESVDGNVTGAGFEQLADIADYLCGLIVTNGTAFILRSQGISYATPTGNATLPYDINHIGLGDEGEGAQCTALITQYDQTGAFVGNSDIFQVSGQVSSIGAKIKSALFQALQTELSVPAYLDANSLAVFIGGDSFPIVGFMVGPPALPANSLCVFLFNANNGTWTTYTFLISNTLTTAMLGVFASFNAYAISNKYNLRNSILALQTGTAAPVFFELAEGIANQNSISNTAYITFPQEELLFGRDVTIDSIYIAIWAAMSVNVSITVTFLIGGQTFAIRTFTPDDLNSLAGDPVEFQIFPFEGTHLLPSETTGVFTAHSPQLQIQVTSFIDNVSIGQLRFSKIMVLGTTDPNQRPT